MPKLLRSVLPTLLAVVLVAGTALAQRPSEEALESLAVELERAYGVLLDLSERAPEFRAHGKGIYSISYPLSRDGGRELEAQSLGPLRALAVGHQVSDPSNISTLINAVLSTPGLTYNWWFVVLNTGAEVVRKTVNTINGPGPNFRREDDLLYASGSIILNFYAHDQSSRMGTFTQKVNITSGGAAKARFFSQ